VRLPNGSGVSREAPAPFCEGLTGKFRGSTHHSLHWTLDVTFREDESRIRKEAAPENCAIFRHIALNIIRRNTSIDASVKRKRHLATLNDDVRTPLTKGLN
jgi:nicotinic acid phosphoribosyltransferase